jgi:hypothetical protein
VQIDATNGQVDGLTDETVTFNNGMALQPTDWLFV